jgi:hypothetical protein
MNAGMDPTIHLTISGRSASREFSHSNGKDPMKTSAWHSIRPGETVHHDNTACTEGNNIETHYRRSGTGGKPLCDHCKKLDDAGK